MGHTVLVVVAVIGIVGYVIGRQLIGEPQRGKRLIVLPAILAVIGVIDLGKNAQHPQALDIVFIAISAVVAAGIGLAQGSMMRLQNRNGGLWGQMPVASLWLWVALIVSRVLLGVIAGASGAHVAASTAPILFVLGVNRLAQAAMIAPRAIRAGIPFAAEKDGSTFGSGFLTANRTQTPQQPTASQQPTAPQQQAIPERPTTGERPATGTWQETGAQFVTAVGGALQQRRAQRGRDRRSR